MQAHPDELHTASQTPPGWATCCLKLVHILSRVLRLWLVAPVRLDMGLKGQIAVGKHFRVGEQRRENSNCLHIQFELFWESNPEHVGATVGSNSLP